MKLTSYFIKHPVISIVINCLIVILGILSLSKLTVREYPNIIFPTINVKIDYPNASSELVESAVSNVLEGQLAGIEGLETITSSSSNGSSLITLLFRSGTKMSQALNSVQDEVGRAQGKLPLAAKTPVIKRERVSTGLPFIAIALQSDSRSFGELTHYANLNLKNIFRSVDGVSSVSIWGQPYTYNIILSPEKLFSFGINVDDITKALSKNNISLPTGNYQGKIPSTINLELKSIKDYENLLIKDNGKFPVLLKSVATISLDTDISQTRVRVNGSPGIVISIKHAIDANPVDVSNNVRKAVSNLHAGLPADMKINVLLDQSDFINASLKNIRSSILEAILLVLIVVFIFLRNLRATIIPLLTIPISLLGSLVFLQLFGFSINLMTLLGMVLAIGLVVDDAIIVLENIWRHMEEGESSYQAAIKGSREIGFAIIAMTLTLASVYLPIIFIQGMIGQLFIEFAVALAGSVFISGIVALTLSPLMCKKLLKIEKQSPLLEKLNKIEQKIIYSYSNSLKFIIDKQKIFFLTAALSIITSVFLYNIIHHETAPKEDRGLVGIYTASIAGDDIEKSERTTNKIESIISSSKHSGDKLTFISESVTNTLLPLLPHAQRQYSAKNLVNKLQPLFEKLPSVDPHVWSWDIALPGIDNTGTGSELSLEISSYDDYQTLYKNINKLNEYLINSKKFKSINNNLNIDSTGYDIKLNQKQLSVLGLSTQQIAKTIEVFFSGDRSQAFNKDGIEYNLTIKGKNKAATLNELYITSPRGKRISLGAIAKMQKKSQPVILNHFQQMRSVTFHVQLNDGMSLAKGSKELFQLAQQQLPENYRLTWTGSIKDLNNSSYTMLFLLVLAVLFIYAILAMQFESFIDPLIILFTVPLAAVGALLAAYLFNQSLNVYTQIGLITLIGLISKHGILIVEFANQLIKAGNSPIEAIQKAANLRLRPILMTTGAMIFGVIPLVLSSDAGSESRRAIGIILIGGLSIGTLFTLFVLPAIYNFIKNKNKNSRASNP